MTCPDLFALNERQTIDELREHVASCATCRSLLELRAASAGAGAASRGDGCVGAEVLIGLLASGHDLVQEDADELEQHLGACAGCAATLVSVVLEGDGGEDREAAERRGSSGVRTAVARRRSAPLVAAGAVALAAAAVLVAIALREAPRRPVGEAATRHAAAAPEAPETSKRANGPAAARPPTAKPPPPSPPPPIPPKVAFDLEVVDERGAPVPGAHALVLDFGGAPMAGTYAAPLVADRAGKIAVAFGTAYGGTGRMPVDRVDVGVWAPGHGVARRTDLETATLSGRVVTIALTPGARFHGRVEVKRRPKRRGQRVRQLWLEAAEPNRSHFYVRCPVDANGRFSIDGLTRGRYRVRAWPLGMTPVLAPDANGQLRLAAAEPGPGRPEFSIDQAELVVDGSAHRISVRFGALQVRGRVVDVDGNPIAGAKVTWSSNDDGGSGRTSSTGEFAIAVEPAEWILLRPFHPDFGEMRDHTFTRAHYSGAIPDKPVELVLPRGVELRGLLLGPDGAPLVNEPIFVVPAYRGSGPRPVEASTNADGRFAFPRMALADFEIVIRSMDHWNMSIGRRAPRSPYPRLVAQQPSTWLAEARKGHELVLRTERVKRRYIAARVVDGSDRPLKRTRVQVWQRFGAKDYAATTLTSDARGRVRLNVEVGTACELWLLREADTYVAPWTQNIAPGFQGDPTEATADQLEFVLQ